MTIKVGNNATRQPATIEVAVLLSPAGKQDFIAANRADGRIATSTGDMFRKQRYVFGLPALVAISPIA